MRVRDWQRLLQGGTFI